MLPALTISRADCMLKKWRQKSLGSKHSVLYTGERGLVSCRWLILLNTGTWRVKRFTAQGQGKGLGKRHWGKHLPLKAPTWRKVEDLKPIRKIERKGTGGKLGGKEAPDDLRAEGRTGTGEICAIRSRGLGTGAQFRPILQCVIWTAGHKEEQCTHWSQHHC